jgi:hypothetical protein
MQYYNVYFIWNLLYMFRVVPSPITSSDNSYLPHLSILYERSKLRKFGIYGQSVISHNTYLNRYHCDTQNTASCLLSRTFICSARHYVNLLRPYEHDNLFSYRDSRALRVSGGWGSTVLRLRLGVEVASLTTCALWRTCAQVTAQT